jgi:hypothetical protein
MTFKMVWKSTGELVIFDDAAKQFRFTGTRASCPIAGQGGGAFDWFSWESDALETSRADFAVMGEEMNGRYYK